MICNSIYVGFTLACTDCPAGSRPSFGADQCVGCPKDKYQSGTNCITCQPGREKVDESTKIHTDRAPNSFTAACTPCPAGIRGFMIQTLYFLTVAILSLNEKLPHRLRCAYYSVDGGLIGIR